MIERFESDDSLETVLILIYVKPIKLDNEMLVSMFGLTRASRELCLSVNMFSYLMINKFHGLHPVMHFKTRGVLCINLVESNHWKGQKEKRECVAYCDIYKGKKKIKCLNHIALKSEGKL